MAQDSYSEELVGICGECGSTQRDSYMNKNPFFQQGSPVPCGFCGGVVVIGNRADKETILKQINRQRGIGSG